MFDSGNKNFKLEKFWQLHCTEVQWCAVSELAEGESSSISGVDHYVVVRT